MLAMVKHVYKFTCARGSGCSRCGGGGGSSSSSSSCGGGGCSAGGSSGAVPLEAFPHHS